MSQINSEFPPCCEAGLAHPGLLKPGFLPHNMPSSTLPTNDGQIFQSTNRIPNNAPHYLLDYSQHLPSPYSPIYSSHCNNFGYPFGTTLPSYAIGNPPPPQLIPPLERTFQADVPILTSKPVPTKPLENSPPPALLKVPAPTKTKKRKSFHSIEQLAKCTETKCENAPSTALCDSNPKKCDKLPTSRNECSSLMYPAHFMRGSIIELTKGKYKRVEDMTTDDFVCCTKNSSDLKIDSSTVVKIYEKANIALLSFSVGENKIQVTVEATYEHPFYVFGQGWSSCSPPRTLKKYGLSCKQLMVGDICISLTHKHSAMDIVNQNTIINERSAKSKSVPVDSNFLHENDSKKRRWSAPEDIEDAIAPN